MNFHRIQRRRRGFTLLEVSVAAVLFAALLTIAVEALQAVTHQRRAAELRQTALQEAINVLERLTVLDATALDADRVAQETLDPRVAKLLPGGKLQVELSAVEGTPQGKRLSIRVDWNNLDGNAARSVTLSAWVFAPATTDEAENEP